MSGQEMVQTGQRPLFKGFLEPEMNIVGLTDHPIAYITYVNVM